MGPGQQSPVIFADEPTGNLDTKSEEEIVKILKDPTTRAKPS